MVFEYLKLEVGLTTNTARIVSPRITSTINPTQGLVDYVGDVKPYHSKILDVLVEYVYTEQINTTIQEQWGSDMAQAMSTDSVGVSSGAVQVPILVPTTIGERFGFDVHLFLQDSIAATMEDIRPVGYGMDSFSTEVGGGFGTNPDPDGLSITAIGTGNTTFLGSISGTVLTATNVSGVIGSNVAIQSATVLPNTFIQNQLTGLAGGAGTYAVSVSQTVAVPEQMSVVSVSTPLHMNGFDQDLFDV
jgi:hypothetical protein